TPYIVVWVNERTDVPREYVQNNEIVLNISVDATKDLRIDNDLVTFSARFAGVGRQVFVPVGNVMSIFARETGEGMGFDVELASTEPLHAVDSAPPALPGEKGNEADKQDKPKGPPSLRIVK
ncbi:MAG: ClpXP protease specificity-enhancing factor, partial [Paludibacterium sp.]